MGLASDFVPPSPAAVTIRPFAENDAEAVLRISIRAWAAVIPSIEQALGLELYRLLTPDWRAEKREEIAAFLGAAQRFDAWVADADHVPIAFVALKLDPQTRVGEIYLLAVDPEHQNHGIGTGLTGFAFDEMKKAGMIAAMVETGFDPGHAPARRTYEKAGCVSVPAARYFKQL
jgi:GNAT superfamily N-acetyltransferase